MTEYNDHRDDEILAERLSAVAELTATAEVSTRELLALASDILDNVAWFESRMGVTDTASAIWEIRRSLDAERNVMMNNSAPITLR